MKIFGYEISKSDKSKGVSANAVMEDLKKKDRKRRKDLNKEIRKQTLHRMRADINRWLSARRIAENINTPNNTEKERVYKDILVDAHLTAVMQTLRLMCMSSTFSIYNKDTNEVDEDASRLFKKSWFRKIVKEFVNSKFHGFSLVQLGDIYDGCFEDSELIPRHYVVQQKRGVKRELGDIKSLISFDEPKFRNWLVPMGDPQDLGLLDKAAPLVIKKKEVIAAWSEGAEIFALPLRYMKTRITDVDRKENAEDMMENIGMSAWAVIDEEDEIGLLQASRTDISNMYSSFLEFVNSEISKLFLLQTGTTDEKTHVGSAGVMQDVLKSLVNAYIVEVEDLVNKVVLPIMQRHGLIPLGVYIKADNEQKLSLKELFEIVKDLLPTKNIPNEWISETFSIPIEEIDANKANEKSQSELRGSVGGVQVLVDSVISAVSEGRLELEAAIEIISQMFGFDLEVAKKMIGNPKVIKKEGVEDETENIMEAVNKLYNPENCC